MPHILASPAQLGALVKAARKRLGLSQAQLATRIGISQSRMSELEIKPGAISIEQLLALSGALGFEVSLGEHPEAHAPSTPEETATAAPASRRAGRHLPREW